MTSHTESKQEPTHLEDVATTNQLVILGGAGDHFVDASMIEKASCAHELKTASDGRTVLIPQPSDDPADPLNWSQLRKCLVLLVISCTAFLPDYGSGTGAVTLIPQAKEWGLSEDTVNHSQVGNVFMLGAGGLVVTVLASYFGRLPTLFWFLVMALWTAAWCAGSQTFDQFMAARILNGFFSTVAQGGGMIYIQDIFFLHEHACATVSCIIFGILLI